MNRSLAGAAISIWVAFFSAMSDSPISYIGGETSLDDGLSSRSFGASSEHSIVDYGYNIGADSVSDDVDVDLDATDSDHPSESIGRTEPQINERAAQ